MKISAPSKQRYEKKCGWSCGFCSYLGWPLLPQGLVPCPPYHSLGWTRLWQIKQETFGREISNWGIFAPFVPRYTSNNISEYKVRWRGRFWAIIIPRKSQNFIKMRVCTEFNSYIMTVIRACNPEIYSILIVYQFWLSNWSLVQGVSCMKVFQFLRLKK